MFNMFDMLTQAHNGAAMDKLARQFGLQTDQTQKAVEALMPAFNEGMKRQIDSLDTMQSFFKQMGSANYEKFFEKPEEASTEEMREKGNDVLGQLFGSKDVSRAVADQAAAMTGLGADILRQMLPVVASMMMGGLARQSAASNPFQQMMEQMMSAGMTGGGSSGNPLADMYQNMMKNFAGAAMPKGGTGAGAFDPSEIIDALFTAGRKTQDANTEAMHRIFEQFTSRK
ncbi:DUF937 domain-containing protein [Tepidamorphus sp. 3E244]|uniref:DUF937 domain-containing protein n=1 Tax=Tepidamorphus sp. 3E244 TaxID=3385498 RepID=UPI0038FD1067